MCVGINQNGQPILPDFTWVLCGDRKCENMLSDECKDNNLTVKM